MVDDHLHRLPQTVHTGVPMRRFPNHSCFSVPFCFLLLALVFQGCQWHDDMYKQYAGERGYVEPCQGFCISANIDKENCQPDPDQENKEVPANPYLWLDAFCLDAQGNILKDIKKKNDCNTANGTWFPEQCKILSEAACTSNGGDWASMELYYKGDDQYIQALDGEFYCGTFDQIMHGKATPCPPEDDIEQYKEDIDTGLCNANTFCQSITIVNASTLNQKSVAACSICPSDHVLCNGVCTNIMEDSNNCGTCGNSCDTKNTGKTCINGFCAEPCKKSPESDEDGDSCPDINGIMMCIGDHQTNHEHCGECNHACDPDENCIDGECQPASNI